MQLLTEEFFAREPFAVNMERACANAGMTLADLGRAARVSILRMGEIATGQPEASLPERQRIAGALGVTVQMLERPPGVPARTGERSRPQQAAARKPAAPDPRQPVWDAVRRLQAMTARTARNRANDPAVVYASVASEIDALTKGLKAMSASGQFRSTGL